MLNGGEIFQKGKPGLLKGGRNFQMISPNSRTQAGQPAEGRPPAAKQPKIMIIMGEFKL